MKIVHFIFQRDIDQIRNYLYETDDWYGHKKNVIYNHKNESYALEKSQVINSDAFFYILIILLTLNNKIDDALYQYLKNIITTFHSDNKTQLLSIIDKQQQELDRLQYNNLSEIEKALFFKKRIHLKKIRYRCVPYHFEI
ncbi:MAG: hypothetical protein O7C58_05900, partial [Rickettsia endosymbiont of Ixodes persulcatus]|nr:hypothetical protein [Rickettsia endosymbiont of Ixodes persulcatus]